MDKSASPISSPERLARRYAKHNRLERGIDFAVEMESRLAFFNPRVKSGGHLLDIGCRDGAFSMGLPAQDRLVGLDIDQEALARAKAKGMETMWGDVEAGLPFEDASFDAVLVAEILEHLRDPSAMLAEIHRVLRPGGRVLGSVPNAFRVKNRLRFLVGRPPETDPTHLQMFSPSQLHDLCSDASFKHVEVDQVGGRFIVFSHRWFGYCSVFAATKPA